MPSTILPLSDDQKAQLQKIAQTLHSSESRIAAEWGAAYRQALQDPGDHVISDEKFQKQVQLFITSLADGDFKAYFDRITKTGLELARNRTPYENLILSFHLFEDASAPHLRRLFPEGLGETLSVLDHLYHNVIAILARAYFNELEREREKLVHILAHDLKVPLTGILLAAQTISSGKVTQEKQLDLAATIFRAGNSMSELIERMLEYGKLRAGKLSPKLQEINLNQLAADAVRLQLPAASARGLTVTVNGAEAEKEATWAPILLTADPQLLSRAIGNYLSNAIKHAASSVAVRLADEGESVSILVDDDGPGVPQDQLCLIFEDYFVSPGNKAGTGLGLPSVRMIAKLHGGKYDVRSTPGQGSTFVLSLPRRAP